MDIKQYIASGILEEYVLGMISETEAKIVEQNLLQYPELKIELNKVEDALASYAQAKAIPMPEGLSTSIMQSIHDLESGDSPISDTTPTNSIPQAAIPKTTNTLGIILGLALLGSLLGNFFLNQQKQLTQDQLVQSETKLTTLNDKMVTQQLECDQKDSRIVQLEAVIASLKNPASKQVIMSGDGTPIAPNVEAIVHFNPAENSTYLDISNLPAAPTDRDYQLWAIVDGAPTDMGIIDLTAAVGGLLKMNHINNPQAFAVTLEPRDDDPAPNLIELYVIGNVG